MSPKDEAITICMPKSLKAQTACSLDEPQPKLSRVNKTLALSYGALFKIKSLFIFLSSLATPSFPSSKYLQPSNK